MPPRRPAPRSAHSPASLRVARALCWAFLADDTALTPAALHARGKHALGHPWPWLKRLAAEAYEALRYVPPSSRHERVLATILDFAPFQRACRIAPAATRPRPRAYLPSHPIMASPPPALRSVTVPALATPGELAGWLGVSLAELDAYADLDGWRTPRSADARHGHYHYRWLAKRDGGARLIEAPKHTLRALQRRVLAGLLNHVPPHDAAHGCVPGRSVRSHAVLHSGAAVLVKLDLRDFFGRIPAGRIHALFRSLGYPPACARYLTGLTTHCTPRAVAAAVPQAPYASPEARRRQLRWGAERIERHLPQGAPTSPALANLCAYRLDVRLAGLAAACGGRYSRYVDDLSISLPQGDAPLGRRVLRTLAAIALEEGFEPNWRKAGVFPAAVSQRVTGVVVNHQPNLPRAEYDRLKAIVHNCRRHGPDSQNHAGHPDFRAHLRGRLAWLAALNPAKGARLLHAFAQIDWPDTTDA